MEKEENKFVKSMPLIFYGMVAGILIYMGAQSLFKKEDNEVIPEDKFKITVSVSSEEISKSREIVVETDALGDKEYSFDGGYTWQKENTYVATSNGEIVIQVKDSEGNIVKQNYTVSNIDNIGPKISYVYNKDILVGDKIDVKSLFNISDEGSGLSENVVISPSSIDTKKSGIKKISVTAYDKIGNVTSLTFEIPVSDSGKIVSKDVVEGETVTKTKYYRYRTKNVIEVDCNPHTCNTYDGVKATIDIVATGKCPSDYKTSKDTTRNGCMVPSPRDVSCTQAITPVYVKNSDGLYYSRVAIKKEVEPTGYKAAPCGSDEKEMDGYCHAICEKNGKSTGKCPSNYKTCSQTLSNGCVVPKAKGTSCTQAITKRFRTLNDGSIYDAYALSSSGSSFPCDNLKGEIITGGPYAVDAGYKVSPCDENEFEYNGYCHAMCEMKKVTCPKGYFADGDMCKVVIKKTCYDKCGKTTYGEWSEWSTKKVVASDNIQVEEKYE